MYFSSVTENTKRFIDKLPFPSVRISLKVKDDLLKVDYPYVLATPTYKGGANDGAVPKQVINFLNHKENRDLCTSVLVFGNINFNEDYTIAGDVISQKLQVPILRRVELMGTPLDVDVVTDGLNNRWGELLSLRGLDNQFSVGKKHLLKRL